MKLFDYRCMRRNYEVKEITENQDIVLQWREFDHKQERLEAERAEQRPPRGLRLLVMDLDGTLTNDEKRILPETKAALMRLQREGVRLVLASGRPTPGIMPLARELQLDRFGGFILSFNGGMVIDAQTGAVLHCQTLSAEEQRLIVEEARRDGHAPLSYLDGRIVCEAAVLNDYILEEARINKMDVTLTDDLLRDLVREVVVKLLVVGEPGRLAETEAAMQRLRGMGVWAYRSQPFFLETVPAGIDKAESLKRLLAHLGMTPENMMAIGDGGNDLSMIRLAGVGVAMANSMPNVCEGADWVTTRDNNHDGVGEAVGRFFFGEG